MNEEKFASASNNDLLSVLMVRGIDSQNPILFGTIKTLYSKLNFDVASERKPMNTNYRSNYNNRPDRQDRPDRSDKPDRPDRPDRSDRPNRFDRPDRPDGSDGSDGSDKQDRPEKPEYRQSWNRSNDRQNNRSNDRQERQDKPEYRQNGNRYDDRQNNRFDDRQNPKFERFDKYNAGQKPRTYKQNPRPNRGDYFGATENTTNVNTENINSMENVI